MAVQKVTNVIKVVGGHNYQVLFRTVVIVSVNYGKVPIINVINKVLEEEIYGYMLHDLSSV